MEKLSLLFALYLATDTEFHDKLRETNRLVSSRFKPSLTCCTPLCLYLIVRICCREAYSLSRSGVLLSFPSQLVKARRHKKREEGLLKCGHFSREPLKASVDRGDVSCVKTLAFQACKTLQEPLKHLRDTADWHLTH